MATSTTDEPIVIDIEVTNRCNADCHFCPRDQTPHEGLMSPEVFDQALWRAEEYRAVAAELLDADTDVSLCGLGEPLINKNTPSWVRAVKQAGFGCTLSSNGALLDERRGQAVLDAGLDRIMINVGDIGEAYEEVYKLPWERTHDNVVRFVELAGDACEVHVVLVDYKGEAAHVEAMKAFWRARGVTHFVEFGIMNRGGSLFVDHMQFETLPQYDEARRLLAGRDGPAICGAPFAYLFVGYDGNYYLCCSDWRKEVPLGSVFDVSFRDVIRPKLEHVAARSTVCRTCNLDPLNVLTDELRARDEGEHSVVDPEVMAAQMVDVTGKIGDVLDKLVPDVSSVLTTPRAPRRRRIPVFGR